MFSYKLKELRQSKKLTQRELASLLSLQHTAISKYELGEREPDYETLKKIGDYFDVSIDYLLGRTEEISKKSNNPYKERTKDIASDVISESQNYITVNPEDVSIIKDLLSLSPENKKEIEKLIELYKIKEMQERNIKKHK